MASFAAIFAIGKPVALDASADERDTRGFISITTIRPSAGLTANWMLQPPVSTPTSRSTAMPRSRRRWYSRSVSVMAGATVTLSPVCTPIGSMFSIEQTTTTLSCRSRISSSSYSFQPSTLSSMSTSCTGLAARPAPAIRARSSGGVRHAGAEAAHGERRPDHHRQAQLGDGRLDLVHRVADPGAGHQAGRVVEAEPYAGLGDDLLEQLPVLAAADRVDVGADQLDAVLVQHARPRAGRPRCSARSARRGWAAARPGAPWR